MRRWHCRSRTTPGVVYELVTIGGRVLSCSCPAGDYGRECWHKRGLETFLQTFTEKEWLWSGPTWPNPL